MRTPSRHSGTRMRIWKDKERNWHRHDGPAVEWDDGTKWWHAHGTCRQSERGDQARREEHPAYGVP